MIPVELIYVLVPIAVVVSIFAVWNLDNRIYANIVLGGFISSVLWFFLAANVITGNVVYDSADMDSVMIDVPLFWIFILFGVASTIYTLVLSLEAISEGNVPDIGEDESGY